MGLDRTVLPELEIFVTCNIVKYQHYVNCRIDLPHTKYCSTKLIRLQTMVCCLILFMFVFLLHCLRCTIRLRKKGYRMVTYHPIVTQRTVVEAYGPSQQFLRDASTSVNIPYQGAPYIALLRTIGPRLHCF